MNPVDEVTVNGQVIDLSDVEDDVLVPEGERDAVAYRCPGCGYWFEAADWENHSMTGDLSEETLCWPCYEQDLSAPSTVHRFVPGEEASEHEWVVFGDHTGYGMTEGETGEVFEWFDALFEEWRGRAYHHSDGWRGYHCTERHMTGITVLDDGWMTGDYGDVPWKRDSHAFMQALLDGTITAPATMYVMFEPTSNVFSTATTVFCLQDDADALRDWLEAGQPYDLHRALT